MSLYHNYKQNNNNQISRVPGYSVSSLVSLYRNLFWLPGKGSSAIIGKSPGAKPVSLTQSLVTGAGRLISAAYSDAAPGGATGKMELLVIGDFPAVLMSAAGTWCTGVILHVFSGKVSLNLWQQPVE